MSDVNLTKKQIEEAGLNVKRQTENADLLKANREHPSKDSGQRQTQKNVFEQHPTISKEAQFTGADPQNQPMPNNSQNITDGNASKEQELVNKYQPKPTHTPSPPSPSSTPTLKKH